VYLLFVDESGTHGGSHSFVLGGIAVHEQDASRLAADLDRLVSSAVSGLAGSPEDYELHASEVRNPVRKKKGSGETLRSPWAELERQQRLRLLRDAYGAIAGFRPREADLPPVLFGVVLSARFRSSDAVVDRERYAYEVLLNKFDVMLKRTRASRDSNRGLVIHDRRIVAERDIQEWTRQWQTAAGAIGQIRNLADVPLFADSRATRLLQAADLVSYALYRHYDPARQGEDYVLSLWQRFDAVGTAMHGCVHFTPSFGAGVCRCLPCQRRLSAEVAPRRATLLGVSGAGASSVQS